MNCGNDNQLTTYLIFENVRSIMNGKSKENQQFFSQIPLNTAIKIIGIQNISGQPQLCIQEARTSGTEITLNDFQPFTLADLKAEINAIN